MIQETSAKLNGFSILNSHGLPFIKWAGGKKSLVNKLLPLLPKDVQSRIYREPFLGSGSLFFSIHPEKAFLSDLNEDLINTFISVRNNPKLIHNYLVRFKKESSFDYYYETRDLFNKRILSNAQAARFIYLNKTCFNGIYRVNSHGHFNVPFGYHHIPSIPKLEALICASTFLKNAKLFCSDYVDSLADSEKGDFIYLDPPYPPLNGTSSFTHYTKESFLEKDQITLSENYKKLNSRGCLVMMTNADTPEIRKLYSSFNINTLSVTRIITCKSIKHKVSELVIRNYH